MSVNLIMSGTSGGSDLSEDVSLGSCALGATSSTQEIYISHDAIVNEITDVALYIMRDVSSGYLGDDPDADIVSLLGWADDTATDGVQINMNASSPSWVPMKTGSGDESAPLDLLKESIVVGSVPASDGIIPVGGEAKVELKVKVPSSISGTAGIMGFSLVVAYSATS